MLTALFLWPIKRNEFFISGIGIFGCFVKVFSITTTHRRYYFMISLVNVDAFWPCCSLLCMHPQPVKFSFTLSLALSQTVLYSFSRIPSKKRGFALRFEWRDLIISYRYFCPFLIRIPSRTELNTLSLYIFICDRKIIWILIDFHCSKSFSHLLIFHILLTGYSDEMRCLPPRQDFICGFFYVSEISFSIFKTIIHAWFMQIIRFTKRRVENCSMQNKIT